MIEARPAVFAAAWQLPAGRARYSPTATDPGERGVAHLTALVIDDSKVMRTLVMQAVQQTRLAQFEFVEAADGAEALDKFDPAVIDLCLVDWNMPNVSGLEFVRQARTRPGADRVPMVMVTSEKTLARIDEALAAGGADVYVCKPFTAADLAVKLERVVNRVQAAKTTTEGSRLFARLFG